MEEERWGGGKHKTKIIIIIMVFRRGEKGGEGGRACSLAKERARMGGDGKREEKGRVDLAGGARFGMEGKAQCRIWRLLSSPLVSSPLLSSPLLSSPLLSSPLLSLGKRGGKRDTAARAVPRVSREEGRWREGEEKRGGRGREAERKERRDSNGVWGGGGDKRHRRARSA